MILSYSFWQLPNELFELWHEHRTPVLVITISILTTLRIWLRYRYPREATSVSPASRSLQLYEKETLVDGGIEKFQAKPFESAEKGLLKPTKPLRRASPRRVTGKKLNRSGNVSKTLSSPGNQQIAPIVFFSSLGGTTQAAAKALVSKLNLWRSTLTNDQSDSLQEIKYLDLSYIEKDDFFISPPQDQNLAYFYLFLLPTYNIDTVLDDFLEHLQETHNDFRIDTAPLSGILGYSVFGFGDKQDWPTEEEGFCSQAKEVDRWMAKLTGRKRAFPMGMGDVRSDATERLDEWTLGVQDAMIDIMAGRGLGEGVPGSGDAVESDEEEVEEPQAKTSLDDVEDLGRSYNKTTGAAPLAIDFTTYGKIAPSAQTQQQPKEMVPKTSPTFAALTKQGYTIVGSHSGVKICRWTKSALRGRGSCYKYSFYGIKSNQCMETTPSLSCSNKCVFCWRHGTNPVGTTWRWKVDPPQEIFDGVKAGHYQKIKMMKGVPGVRAERFQEAMRIRHCALSLVGEPIFYPHINEFTALLHKERISSFLVCNAQHPDQLAALHHVTQLYVSIDASNKESLRKIDRPLHRDFWERFTRCLDILREKRFMQRTVFRLTLVKGFNIDDEVGGYADLVQRGLPCFIEVKGVTFCGTSTSSSAGLTMQNVPFYNEIQAFVLALDAELQKRGLDYGIAAEHAHSCCVLFASERFKRDGKWCTTIDYDKFFECLEGGGEFGPDDYIGPPTHEWALWGNGGFDPRDVRVDKRGRPKDVLVNADFEAIDM